MNELARGSKPRLAFRRHTDSSESLFVDEGEHSGESDGGNISTTHRWFDPRSLSSTLSSTGRTNSNTILSRSDVADSTNIKRKRTDGPGSDDQGVDSVSSPSGHNYGAEGEKRPKAPYFISNSMKRTESMDALYRHSTTSLTLVNTVSGSHRWTIKGVSGLDHTPGASTRSNPFSLCGETWIMELFPGGSGFGSGSERSSPGIYVYLKSNKPTLNAKLSLYLIRAGRRVKFSNLITKVRSTMSDNEGERWAYGDPVPKEVLSDLSLGFIASDGSITIDFDAVVYSPPRSVRGADITLPPSRSAEELRTLWKSSKYADVKIYLDGVVSTSRDGGVPNPLRRFSVDINDVVSGREPDSPPPTPPPHPQHQGPFLAHKCILSARCAYFSEILTDSNEIRLVDLNRDAFHVFLEYLYTDQISEAALKVLAKDLLEMGKKFGVERLTSICEGYLLSEVNASNAADHLMFAERNSATNLKDGCLDFISSHSSAVMKSSSWTKLVDTTPDLLAELFANATGARKRSRTEVSDLSC